MGILAKYRVWIRSKPGMYEQYAGYVDVISNTRDNATEAALNKLKNTSFPDRNRGMWIVDKVERI